MKKLILLICILWTAVIFYNSFCIGNVSQGRSLEITRLIINEQRKLTGGKAAEVNASKVQPVIKGKPYLQSSEERSLNFYLRKNAHVLEFMVLALLVSTVFSVFGMKSMDTAICIMFICLLCAVSDEFVQKFIPGRTSSVGDVLIDFGGSITGIVLLRAVNYVRKNKKIY